MKRKKAFKCIVFLLMTLFLFSSFSLVTNAEEGDFYKKHKKIIDKELPYEMQREMVEIYDSETNSFDCGTFDPFCQFEGMMLSMQIGAIKNAYGGLSDFVITPTEITGNSVFKKFKNGLSGFSTTMLAIFLMWQVMKIVASRYADSSDGGVAINDKLLMVLASGIMLGIYDDFFIWILQIQEILVEGALQDPFKLSDVMIIVFTSQAGAGFLIAFMIVGVLLIFSIAYMYRFVLFGLLYIVGVVAIPTAVNDEYNYFSLWLKLLINNGVTLFLQSICFALGVQALIKNNSFSDDTTFSIAMAFFILALSVPALLGQLGASSGSSKALGSLLRQAVRRR